VLEVPESTAADELLEDDPEADPDYLEALKMSQDEYYAHEKAGDSSASSGSLSGLPSGFQQRC
jgi:hypothetical protein